MPFMIPARLAIILLIIDSSFLLFFFAISARVKLLRQKGCRNKREEGKERGGEKEQGRPRGKDPMEAI